MCELIDIGNGKKECKKYHYYKCHVARTEECLRKGTCAPIDAVQAEIHVESYHGATSELVKMNDLYEMGSKPVASIMKGVNAKNLEAEVTVTKKNTTDGTKKTN